MERQVYIRFIQAMQSSFDVDITLYLNNKNARRTWVNCELCYHSVKYQTQEDLRIISLKSNLNVFTDNL